jgi:hypothetical protein
VNIGIPSNATGTTVLGVIISYTDTVIIRPSKV